MQLDKTKFQFLLELNFEFKIIDCMLHKTVSLADSNRHTKEEK